MESASGKLKNKDTGEELPFSLNPTEYHLTRAFTFAVEPCLGQSSPVLSFQSGMPTELSCQLIFDEDADSKLDSGKVHTFIGHLNHVNPDTKSVPLLEFSMGGFVFRGYTRSFSFHPVRFNAKGDATSSRFEFTLLSNGDYENAKR